MKRRFAIGALALSCVAAGTITSCGSSGATNDVLVIGMECSYQPFNWTTTSETDYTLPIYGTSGEYADGYDIQIAKRLSEITGKEVEIHRIVWDSLIVSLQTGEINMILAGMSSTEARREQISFTDAYLTSDLAFLIRTENLPEGNSEDNPATYEELLELFSGKNLICQASVVGDDYIDTYFTSVDSSIIHSNPVSTYPNAALQVSQGTAFAMPAELPVCEAMVNINSDELSVLYVEQDFISEDDSEGLSVNIGVKKGNDELLEELNDALAEISEEERESLMGEAAIRSANA